LGKAGTGRNWAFSVPFSIYAATHRGPREVLTSLLPNELQAFTRAHGLGCQAQLASCAFPGTRTDVLQAAAGTDGLVFVPLIAAGPVPLPARKTGYGSV